MVAVRLSDWLIGSILRMESIILCLWTVRPLALRAPLIIVIPEFIVTYKVEIIVNMKVPCVLCVR